jgi:hypothetical protein
VIGQSDRVGGAGRLAGDRGSRDERNAIGASVARARLGLELGDDLEA